MICRANECSDDLVPNKKELTDRVLAILQKEECLRDEYIGLLLQKERNIDESIKILSLLIDRANSSDATIIDPSLFSACVNNTKLNESIFISMIEYMNANRITITDEFLQNAYLSLTHDPANINALLDIIDSFSQESENLPGSVWRQLMRRLRESDIPNKLALQQQGYVHNNRESLLYETIQVLLHDDLSISFLFHFDLFFNLRDYQVF